MSDTAEDIGFHGRQLLSKSKTAPIREKVRDFVAKRSENPSKQGV
ncbi:MAG: hypothetical protein ACOCTH_00240 [Halodesulfurarchaeum sp.]